MLDFVDALVGVEYNPSTGSQRGSLALCERFEAVLKSHISLNTNITRGLARDAADAPPNGGAWDRAFALEHFAFFDLEMTGLSADHDQIVEIAAAVWDAGDAAPRVWSRVIRATIASSPKAHEVHKISQAEIDAGESVTDALSTFLTMTEGRVLVGHSPGLDLQFLERVVANTLSGRPAPRFALDTLVLARRALRAERYTLESLCKSLGIVTHRSHRAADDALATAALFARVAPMFGPRDARDLWQVRVGQQREISVRTAIAERIEQGRDSRARVEIVVRQGGSAPRTIRGVIERWEPPHVRVRRANATPVLLRADRILRIDELPRARSLPTR